MAGNASRSIQELSAEVATNPNSTAFVELAAAYRRRGDLERARRLCLRGLQRHPTHVEAHYELGRIYEEQGERELALDEWSVVRQLAPDHIPARCATVRLYLDEGRYAEAKRELGEIRRLAPADATVNGLWEQYLKVRSDGAEGDAPSLFDELEIQQPGTLGVLLVDGAGNVLAGQISAASSSSDEELGMNMSAARAEAERVASYLQLGKWTGMVVEGGAARLSVSPLKDGVVIVATEPGIPAGRALRVEQRAREIAKTHLGR